jgi:hypothetical protein
LLAPAAVKVISTSGKHEIANARTGDRAGRTLAFAWDTRKSWGCGQSEDNCSCECKKYLRFHNNDCSPLIQEPAGAIGHG